MMRRAPSTSKEERADKHSIDSVDLDLLNLKLNFSNRTDDKFGKPERNRYYTTKYKHHPLYNSRDCLQEPKIRNLPHGYTKFPKPETDKLTLLYSKDQPNVFQEEIKDQGDFLYPINKRKTIGDQKSKKNVIDIVSDERMTKSHISLLAQRNWVRI